MNLAQGDEVIVKGDNPAQLLERVFAHIARTRMADVPILNPALHVEAVDFCEWQGRWIGVLVTPWTLNLVLLPGADTPLIPLALDEKASWNFPSGAYEFMGLNESAIGTCHTCSLISPVTQFETHEQAVAVAQEVMAALFVAGASEDARLNGESMASRTMSRRDFLRMSFRG